MIFLLQFHPSYMDLYFYTRFKRLNLPKTISKTKTLKKITVVKLGKELLCFQLLYPNLPINLPNFFIIFQIFPNVSPPLV